MATASSNDSTRALFEAAGGQFFTLPVEVVERVVDPTTAQTTLLPGPRPWMPEIAGLEGEIHPVVYLQPLLEAMRPDLVPSSAETDDGRHEWLLLRLTGGSALLPIESFHGVVAALPPPRDPRAVHAADPFTRDNDGRPGGFWHVDPERLSVLLSQ